jgi:preprotein translocase subunit SecB
MEIIMENVQEVVSPQSVPSQKFGIQKLYVKHIEFDIPAAPELFKKKDQPKINFELEIKSDQLPEAHHYEVVLNLKCQGMIEEEKIFDMTIKQAGIFQLEGYTPEQLDQLFNNYCPSIIFPYAREIISETAVRGGLMPILLTPINFDALYAQKKEQEKKQAEKPASHNAVNMPSSETIQ